MAELELKPGSMAPVYVLITCYTASLPASPVSPELSIQGAWSELSVKVMDDLTDYCIRLQ